MVMKELGEKLKKLRLEKGISLEDVQKKTKIHMNILKAIEGEGFTDVSPIYLKSFLKIYCKFLGLPETECDTVQKEPVRPAPREKPATPPPQVKPQARPVSQAGSTLNKTAPKFENGPSAEVLKKIPAYLGIVLVIVIIIFGLTRFVKARHKAAEVNREMAAAVAVKKEVKKPAAKTVKPKAVKAAAVQAPVKTPKDPVSGIRLGIRARENCFIVLKSDGKTVFQRVLGKGRYESWKAADKMELTVGNAAAVELEVNGQLFSKIGRKGQAIKNIVITKEGMRIP